MRPNIQCQDCSQDSGKTISEFHGFVSKCNHCGSLLTIEAWKKTIIKSIDVKKIEADFHAGKLRTIEEYAAARKARNKFL